VTRDVKIDVINQLATRVLFKQFVEGQDIEVSGEEIQERLEMVEYMLKSDPRHSDKSLKEYLETQGSNIGKLEDSIRLTLALGKYLDNRVDEEEKISYFESNIGVFNGEKLKLSQILIDTTKLKTAAELETAKQKIEEIKEKIDNGANFAETAREYSTCSSAKDGGEIEIWYTKNGTLVEELDKVAFSMEVGEISEPVKTQFGYHIIKITDKEEGKDVKYEEVEDMVDLIYLQIKTDELLKRLLKKAEIEITL
jgi:parvulin-like peptidyl-prolyl isomerase